MKFVYGMLVLQTVLAHKISIGQLRPLHFMREGRFLQLHQLYIWNYNKRDEAVPTIILRTRRSLRAVHFHPHGAPYLLTAEVNNIESADSPLTLARSSGYSNYTPALFVTNTNSRFCPHLESNVASPCLLLPAYLRDDGILHVLGNESGSTSVQQRSPSVQAGTSDTENQQLDQFATPMDVCPGEPTVSNDIFDAVTVPASNGIEMHGAGGQSSLRLQGSRSISNLERFSAIDDLHVSSLSNTEPMPSVAGPLGSDARRALPLDMLIAGGLDVQMFLRNVESGRQNHSLFGDSRNWEVPFWQGFLMAQNHTGASSSTPITAGSSRGSNRRYSSRSVPGVGSSLLGPQIDEAEVHAASLGVGSEITASMFTPGTELPCTVKLRIWRHDIKEPCVPLESAACRLTISHAVLCSEMGAHFSPCGRFLVACVACLLPQTEGDRGSQLPVPYDGAGSSPTRHPLPSHRVIYELRVYSLEEATFGDILASRAIRAAHCLTSIQFSPTSEHILLAYGRRHSSLLRSIVMEGENGIPVYTILEVYRVSDMELVRVLPSAEDEVNVACFHPSPGGGLVYGTKEGKLRILQHNGADMTSLGMGCFIEENMLEIQRYALEG